MATLSFSTNWPKHMGGQPTNFLPKIWQGLLNEGICNRYDMDEFILHTVAQQHHLFNFKPNQFAPKLTTIREDPHNLWVPGRKIHMVVFNRTKNRFQFAPVIECKETQGIIIENGVVFISNGKNLLNPLDHTSVKRLALNDGFNSVDHFFQWFSTDTKPNAKIIHWTNLKY